MCVSGISSAHASCVDIKGKVETVSGGVPGWLSWQSTVIFEYKDYRVTTLHYLFLVRHNICYGEIAVIKWSALGKELCSGACSMIPTQIDVILRCFINILGYLASERDEGYNAGEMSPGSNTESYPAFAHIELRENPGKNLNHVTCPDWESNPGHLVSRLDTLTVTPQTELLINARHHRVRHALATSLKTLNWEIHEEVHCVSSDGSFRRADIAINGHLKRALVLDPTIRFERNLNQATEVDIEKKSIYEPCLPYLSQKYNVPLKQWSAIGLLFGSRGSISKFTWNYLKDLHIPFDYVIFDGEIIAISESLRNLLCHINKFRNAVILSDSKAAILSIVSKHTPSSQTAEITKILSQLISLNKRIVFQWIPSRCGNLGNENVDALAKKGSTATYRPVTKSTYYSVKRFIKSTYLDFNKQNLITQSQGKKWNSLHQNPQLIPDLPRKSSVAAFRLATGHDCLARHLHRIGIYQSPCPLCN
ncbi:hypothetical protein ANN_23978 [Periplaneta americana]|uniref:RNase H type-1 domain-containing protein n=1 Tax=Periplaneta americana TaxID=6978 RepID=A0ABQ8S2H5_PERAM|nr:hypothetical protein ANN_23978 [Periplaneta americana]